MKTKIKEVKWEKSSIVAMALYPYVLVNISHLANKDGISDVTLNHELIHHKQQKEMFLIFFYLWYIIEYGLRILKYQGDINKAYRNISFEREAYSNENNKNYLNERKPFSWLRYL